MTKIQRIFILFSALIFATEIFAGWRTTNPDSESIILFNDSEDAVKSKQVKLLPLVGNGTWALKNFDLTQLPAEWQENIGGAALRIYLQSADQSEAVRKIPRNGFTEQLEILVNGNSIVLGTGDPRLPTSRKWADIPINAAWVKGKQLEVKIHKLNSPTNDDFVYLGTDVSSPLGSSKVSVNSGKSFTFEHKALAGIKGEYMIRLVLYRQAQNIQVDFSQPSSQKLFQLKDGAKFSKDTLVFDGVKSTAVLTGSENFNVTTKGLTIAGVVRIANNAPGSSKKNHDLVLACKPGSWFIARTGDRFNFSFCSNGENWNNALFGGEYPDLDEWMHFAAVFERVDESAQGNVGYMLKIYLNGELMAKRMFLYAEPTATNNPVMIGNGNFEDYCMNGEFATFDLYSRGLNEGEVSELARKSSRVKKLPMGMFQLTAELESKLNALANAATLPEARWLIGVLRRSAATGYNQKALQELLSNAAPFQGNQKAKELIQKWNQHSSDIKLLPASSCSIAAISLKGRANYPVLGIYNPKTQQDILDSRGAGWTITLDGMRIHDRSNGVSYQVKNLKQTAAGATFQIVWTKAGDFECTSNAAFNCGRLEQDLAIKVLRGNVTVTEVIFPQYHLRKLPGKTDHAVFPLFSGILHKNPTNSFSTTGLYPTARAAMQFTGYFDDLVNGVYTAFEATDGASRTMALTGRNNVLEYKFTNPLSTVKHQRGATAWKSSGVGVVQCYSGNWFEAGQIYKAFVESKAPWAVKELPRKDTPKWYHENTLWWVMSPDFCSTAIQLQKYFDLPYGIWFCRVYNIDKGPEATLSPTPAAVATQKALANHGVSLQTYMNARLWAYTEHKAELVERVDNDVVRNYSIQQENGRPYVEQYARPFAVMCPGSQWWRDNLIKLAGVAAKHNFGGVYWDQLPCGSAQRCWNTSHDHAPGDPTVWSKGYRQMLRDLRAKYPQLALDGEDNSEIYVNTLDGFMSWRFTEPNHVPLFQSVYGGGRTQFVGRAFDAFGANPGSYESAFAKLGEQLVYGEQIGWFHVYDERSGTPRRMYAKKVAHLRRALLGYLNEADMLRPISFKNPVPTMTVVWGNTKGRSHTSDKVLSCGWKRIRDGRVILIFTNTTDETITVNPTSTYPGLTKLAVCMEGAAAPTYVDLSNSPAPAVTLPPYANCVWMLGPDFNRQEAEALAATTRRIADFANEKIETIPGGQPQFDKCKQLTATPGKWITANDASWRLFAFAEGHWTVGYNPTGKPDEKSNWTLARAGAVISYGRVDFGATAPQTLEIQLAAANSNAGGKVELWDVTGDQTPDRCLASITVPSTGGWLTWKTFSLPIKPVTGKRLIVIRVLNQDTNVRSWRVK